MPRAILGTRVIGSAALAYKELWWDKNLWSHSKEYR